MDVELKIPRSFATYLLTPSIYSRPVTDEDHVFQNCRGAPGGQNRDIHLTFSGPRLQRAIGATSRLPSLAALGNKIFANYRECPSLIVEIL